MKLNKLIIAFSCVILAMLSGSQRATAQQKMTPEEEQKRMYETIDAEVKRLEMTLDLNDWQLFMVDSIYTHDYQAMFEELKVLQSKKVENANIYYTVQDKWMEKIYNEYNKVFDEKQWSKYLKQGAARAKKARDKRAASTEKDSAKVKK